MAPRARPSLPTTAALPHSHRLSPSNPHVYKTLSRLSRGSLISLALEWLEESNLAYCRPYLPEDEAKDDEEEDDAPYLAAQSVEELRELYEELQAQKGNKREIVDRIVEGDWRRGLSLYQLAMAETRHLLDHPTSQRWHALRLMRLSDRDGDRDGEPHEEERLPRFRPQTFLQELQHEIGAITRAHYYFTRIDELSIAILRIQLFDTPYNSQGALHEMSSQKQARFETTRSLYIGFPDAAPFVYVSFAVPQTQQPGSEARSVQSWVIDVGDILCPLHSTCGD